MQYQTHYQKNFAYEHMSHANESNQISKD